MGALQALRDPLLATLPAPHERRAEAILDAKGYACRSGPKVKTSPAIMTTIAAAMRGPCRMIMS